MTAGGPPLSVVVVPVLGGPVLGSLLAHLSGEAALPPGAEVLVAGEGEPARVVPPSIQVRHLPATAGASLAVRRLAGLQSCRAEVVAVLEDTVRPLAGWGLAVLALHHVHLEADAIGGTLTLGPGLSAAEAALLALECAPFLRSDPINEPCDTLPASDMSFKRRALERAGVLAGDPADSGDVDIVEVLARRVGAVRCASTMGAICIGADPRRLRPGTRFQEGWSRAAHHIAPGGDLTLRLTRAAVTPLATIAHLRRGAEALARSGMPAADRRARSLPWSKLLVLGAARALGESAGYLLARRHRDR
jgi:hypothetical protein